MLYMIYLATYSLYRGIVQLHSLKSQLGQLLKVVCQIIAGLWQFIKPTEITGERRENSIPGKCPHSFLSDWGPGCSLPSHHPTCVCVWAVFSCVFTCEGQMFLCYSPTYFLRQGLPLNLELTLLAQLEDGQATRILLPPPTPMLRS